MSVDVPIVGNEKLGSSQHRVVIGCSPTKDDLTKTSRGAVEVLLRDHGVTDRQTDIQGQLKVSLA